MIGVLTDPFGWIGQTLLGLFARLGLPVATANLLISLLGAVVLGSVCMTLGALITWVERKIVARFQDRIGPNRVGPFGLLQPIADGLKLLTKETVTPTGADTVVYNLAPLLAVMSVIGLWAVIPLAPRLVGSDINVGVLYIVSIGAIGTLSIMMAGSLVVRTFTDPPAGWGIDPLTDRLYSFQRRLRRAASALLRA